MPLEEIQTLNKQADWSWRHQAEKGDCGKGNVTWPGWHDQIILIRRDAAICPADTHEKKMPSLLSCCPLPLPQALFFYHYTHVLQQQKYGLFQSMNNKKCLTSQLIDWHVDTKILLITMCSIYSGELQNKMSTILAVTTRYEGIFLIEKTSKVCKADEQEQEFKAYRNLIYPCNSAPSLSPPWAGCSRR